VVSILSSGRTWVQAPVNSNYKDYRIVFGGSLSMLHEVVRAKNEYLGTRIMCRSGNVVKNNIKNLAVPWYPLQYSVYKSKSIPRDVFIQIVGVISIVGNVGIYFFYIRASKW
jgi:hypothetical protein